jgi:hypothetical protein
MTLSTLDHVIEGARAGGNAVFFSKLATAQQLQGRWHSFWIATGIPGPGVIPTTVNGDVLDSSSAQVIGQLPFRYPGGGAKCYLGRFLAQSNNTGSIMVADRLWHNLLSPTQTSIQNITAPAWPARDNAGSTNGDGVMLGVELYTAMGAGAPTLNAYYTGTTGITSRLGTNTRVVTTAAQAQGFFPLGLAAFDTGVRTVTGFQLNATWTSGSLGLVAFRPLAYLTTGGGAAFPSDINALTGALVELFPGTVPFLLQMPGSSAVGASVNGCVNYLHR